MRVPAQTPIRFHTLETVTIEATRFSVFVRARQGPGKSLEPLLRAEVELVQQETYQVRQTNGQGRASFDLVPGNYTLRVSCPWYEEELRESFAIAVDTPPLELELRSIPLDPAYVRRLDDEYSIRLLNFTVDTWAAKKAHKTALRQLKKQLWKVRRRQLAVHIGQNDWFNARLEPHGAYGGWQSLIHFIVGGASYEGDPAHNSWLSEMRALTAATLLSISKPVTKDSYRPKDRKFARPTDEPGREDSILPWFPAPLEAWKVGSPDGTPIVGPHTPIQVYGVGGLRRIQVFPQARRADVWVARRARFDELLVNEVPKGRIETAFISADGETEWASEGGTKVGAVWGNYLVVRLIIDNHHRTDAMLGCYEFRDPSWVADFQLEPVFLSQRGKPGEFTHDGEAGVIVGELCYELLEWGKATLSVELGFTGPVWGNALQSEVWGELEVTVHPPDLELVVDRYTGLSEHDPVPPRLRLQHGDSVVGHVRVKDRPHRPHPRVGLEVVARTVSGSANTELWMNLMRAENRFIGHGEFTGAMKKRPREQLAEKLLSVYAFLANGMGEDVELACTLRSPTGRKHLQKFVLSVDPTSFGSLASGSRGKLPTIDADELPSDGVTGMMDWISGIMTGLDTLASVIGLVAEAFLLELISVVAGIVGLIMAPIAIIWMEGSKKDRYTHWGTMCGVLHAITDLLYLNLIHDDNPLNTIYRWRSNREYGSYNPYLREEVREQFIAAEHAGWEKAYEFWQREGRTMLLDKLKQLEKKLPKPGERSKKARPITPDAFMQKLFQQFVKDKRLGSVIAKEGFYPPHRRKDGDAYADGYQPF